MKLDDSKQNPRSRNEIRVDTLSFSHDQKNKASRLMQMMIVWRKKM